MRGLPAEIIGVLLGIVALMVWETMKYFHISDWLLNLIGII